VQYPGGAVTAGRPGLLSAGELLNETLGGARSEDGVPGCDRADGGDQVAGLGVFEQEAAGARTQPGVDVIIEVEGGQDQYLRRQPSGHEVAGGLDAVTAGHPDIHEHNVGMQRGAHGDGGRPVAGLTGHFDIGFGVQDQAKPFLISGWSSTRSTLIMKRPRYRGGR
jgi:hypothetical protein